MTTTTIETKQNITTCPLCLDLFKEPMILPCLHTFCNSCIAKVPKSATFGKIKCPMCNERFEAKSIKSNLYTKRLIKLLEHQNSRLSISEMCVVCNLRQRRTTAVFTCIDCSECLCSGCAEAHLLTKLFANHQIVDCKDFKECQRQALLQNSLPEVNDLSRQTWSFENKNVPEVSFSNRFHRDEENTKFCSHHGEEILEYFCNKCSIPICLNCVVDEHRIHDFIKLSSAVKQKTTEIQRLLTALERKERQVNSALLQRRFQTENLDSGSVLTKQIEDRTDCTISYVKLENQESKEETGHTFKETNKVNTMLKELEYQSRAIKNCITFCKDIFKSGKEDEILYLEKLLTDRLHFLLCFDSSLETVVQKNLKALPSIENIKRDDDKIGLFSFSKLHCTTKNTDLKVLDTIDENQKSTRDVQTQTEQTFIRNSKKADNSVDETHLKIDLFSFGESNDSVFGNDRYRKSTLSPIFPSNNEERGIFLYSENNRKTSTNEDIPAIISDKANIKVSGSGKEENIISIHSENDTRIPSVVGMAMYNNESLVLADGANKVLKVISLDGVCKLEYSLHEIVPQHITVCGNIIGVSGLSKIMFMSKDETWKEILHVENSRGYYPLASRVDKDVIVGNYCADASFPITIFSQTSDPRNMFLKDALPSYMICNNQGQLFVSDLCSHSIRVIDIVKGRELKRISMTREIDALKHDITLIPPIWHPGSLAIDISGKMFVLDKEGKTIVVLDKNGQFVKDTVIDFGTISRPKYLTCDCNGNIYILSNHGDFLHHFKTSMFL